MALGIGQIQAFNAAHEKIFLQARGDRKGYFATARVRETDARDGKLEPDSIAASRPTFPHAFSASVLIRAAVPLTPQDLVCYQSPSHN
jgi:hypothetical protein